MVFQQRSLHTSTTLMAVPKHKPSLSVRRQRWHVQDANKKYAIKRYNYCPTCSRPILPHNICPKCAAKMARQPIGAQTNAQQPITPNTEA